MTTRYFKVLHKAGAFIDGIWYPPVTEDGDASESIVPLDASSPDFKEPLWGVECDASGNDIGELPVGVTEKLSTELANQIAAGAGQGKTGLPPPKEPDPLKNSGAPTDEDKAKLGTDGNGTGTTSAKDADVRKQTIIDTLQLLDHSKADDWTEGGKPKVETVAAASGLEGLTRAEITEAAPDFLRKAE